MKYQMLVGLIGTILFAGNGPKFKDIHHHASESAIKSMCSQGILHGRSASQFAPDAPMTRGEFAAALQSMFKLPSPAHAEAFPDVPPSSTDYQAVQAVTPHLCREMLCFRCALGKNFLPNEIVTRAEMTMILSHILVSQKRLSLCSEAEAKATLASVSDGERIPRPARCYFASAIKSGVVDLKPGSAMALPTPPTRGEIALCMANLQKKLNMPVLKPAH